MNNRENRRWRCVVKMLANISKVDYLNDIHYVKSVSKEVPYVQDIHL